MKKLVSWYKNCLLYTSTNFAAGFQEELNHEEVVEVTERVKGDFKGLLKAILAEL